MNCFYCGKKLRSVPSGYTQTLASDHKTRDHLIPKLRGGKGLRKNTVPSCLKCNHDKDNLTLEEYRLIIAFRQGLIAAVSFKFPGESLAPTSHRSVLGLLLHLPDSDQAPGTSQNSNQTEAPQAVNA